MTGTCSALRKWVLFHLLFERSSPFTTPVLCCQPGARTKRPGSGGQVASHLAISTNSLCDPKESKNLIIQASSSQDAKGRESKVVLGRE